MIRVMTTTTTTGPGRHGGQGDNTERYLLQIRNMIGWMLVLWLLSIAAAVGAGFYVGHHSAQQAAASSDCPGTPQSIALTGC